MKTNEKTRDGKDHEKPPLNPLGIVMLILMLIPATYGLLYLFGVDLSDVVVEMFRADDPPRQDYFSSTGMQGEGLRTMRRYVTRQTVAQLVEQYGRERREAGYEPVAAAQDAPAGKKYRLLEKNGEMRLTFERDARTYDVFAQDRPEGGSVVFETVLPSAKPQADAGDIPGVAVPDESRRYFSIHYAGDDSWLADYHSALAPLELAESLKSRMIEMGWVWGEKKTEQIRLKPGTRMLLFENGTRRCMMWIDSGRNGGSDVTISNMKLLAE